MIVTYLAKTAVICTSPSRRRSLAGALRWAWKACTGRRAGDQKSPSSAGINWLSSSCAGSVPGITNGKFVLDFRLVERLERLWFFFICVRFRYRMISVYIIVCWNNKSICFSIWDERFKGLGIYGVLEWKRVEFYDSNLRMLNVYCFKRKNT